jgi:hypothetical protein
VYYLTSPDCLLIPSYEVQSGKSSCSNIQSYRYLINNVHFDKVVTSFYLFDKYLATDEKRKNEQIKIRVSEYDDFLKFTKNKVDEVFIILGEPVGREFDPKLSMRYNLDNFITLKQAREKYKLHYQALDKLKELNNVVVIDPINYLCQEICMVEGEDNNFHYSDKTHMRPWYAIKSLGYLEPIFK